MATATNAEHRSGAPKYAYQTLSPAGNEHNLDTHRLDWDAGFTHSASSPGDLGEVILEERISLLPGVTLENNGLFDIDGHDSASIAAEKMNQPATEFIQENSQSNPDAGVLSIQVERAYLHCYTAASIGLLCLSATCFVLPSISSYPPERTAVQALSYTGGVISLLSGLAAGASVLSAYTGSGYLHR